MDSDFNKFFVESLQEELEGVDPLSSEYLFDRKYAQHRSEKEMLGVPPRLRSRLSFLLRDCMTDDRRENIFTGPYDLGNKKTVSREDNTYEKLLSALYSDRTEGIEVKDIFETIDKGIHRITGRKRHEYFKNDKSTALKVIKTLDSLRKDGNKRLMQLLDQPIPGKKFSMSWRDSGPYEKNSDQAWLIADLKAYLSVELTKERFEEIGRAFCLLTDIADDISISIEKIVISTHRSNYASAISAYDMVTNAVEDFQFDEKRQDLRLDEELFIHMHQLEFAHFASGHPQLIKVAMPKCQIRPVLDELQDLAKVAFPTVFIKVKEYDTRLSINDIPEFSARWKKEIMAILAKAMEVSMTIKEFDQIQIQVQNLLRTRHFFRVNNIDYQQKQAERVSPWFVVAAFCCVWYTLKDRTNFSPYWLGQASQGGSINSSNKVSLLEIPFSMDSVPEEHRQIWINRLEWFADALRGQSDLRERRFAFDSALLKKLAEICHTNNMSCMTQGLVNFARYIEAYAHR